MRHRYVIHGLIGHGPEPRPFFDQAPPTIVLGRVARLDEILDARPHHVVGGGDLPFAFSQDPPGKGAQDQHHEGVVVATLHALYGVMGPAGSTSGLF